VANAMIARFVPEADRGKAFGVLTSANAVGWALGPMTGGYLAAELGFRQVFYVTGVLFVAVTVWVGLALRRLQMPDAPRAGGLGAGVPPGASQRPHQATREVTR